MAYQRRELSGCSGKPPDIRREVFHPTCFSSFANSKKKGLMRKQVTARLPEKAMLALIHYYTSKHITISG